MSPRLRACSILLLLFAATDLLVPGLCRAEASVTTSADGSSGLPFDSGADGPDVDDCFCCCAHVVPRDFDFSGRAILNVHPVAAAAPQVPVAGSGSLEHPPRA